MLMVEPFIWQVHEGKSMIAAQADVVIPGRLDAPGNGVFLD